MQPKFTQRTFLLFFLKNALVLLFLLAIGQSSIAQKTTPDDLKKQKENWIKNPQSRNSLGPAPGYGASSNRFTPVNPGTNAGNPASRAFCYNGAGPFQLNKQSVLNTTLTSVGPTATFGFPAAEAWVTSVQQLYVVDQAAPFTLYIVDTLSGARTFIANCTGVPHTNLTGITWDATSNTMYGVSSSITASQIFTININTGVCTPIGTPTTVAPGCIQVNAAPDGSLYSVDIVNDALYKWNKTTGVPTLVGSLGIDANFGMDGHFDPSDGQYYWAAFNNTAGQAQLRIIDVTTGSSTLVGTYSGQVATLGIYTPLTTPVCTGTPTPGNTQTTANPVCSGVNFLLSTQIAPAAGLTYQWQSSANVAGPWANLGTGQSQITSQTQATFYRCIVTCGANSATSTPLQITMNTVTNCYCTAGATSTAFEKISKVDFGTISNSSTSTAGYENFTTLSTTLVKGQTAPITVTLSQGFSSDEVRVWIDYNQNGTFTDPGEAVYVSAQGAGPHSGSITISPSASTGSTRMRIRMQDADPFSAPNNATPCGTSLFGQVEDYTINIQPCVQGAITGNPPARSIQCSGSTTFPVVATGSALTYAWQYRVSATSPWLAVTNVFPFSNVTTATLALSNVPASFNGYEFRALVTGPCTATIFSTGGILTITPLVATVNPTAASICTGSIQKISLTNATSPVTAVFAGGAGLPLIVTDNNLVGVSNTAVASGIPANAVVTDVSVNFTMTHTWVGDIVMNLTSPNGQTINLIGALDGGTGSNSSDNFTNTFVSSTGVTPMSGAPAPRTGTFKADLFTTVTFPSSAPTTANTWAPLLTTLNGNWKLTMCDIAAGDQGTLQSWSINITYGAPAAGVWTAAPAAPNTMFTDAAATVPYVAGAPASDIWVKPTVNTSYSVVYTTPAPSGCTSAATTVPVTVVTPVSAPVAPTAKTACVGGSVTFTTSATGGPLTYQWQVSTDNGATFTNINGATSASLTLTALTALMNNNQYRAVITAAPCSGSVVTTSAATLTVNPIPVITIAAPVTQLIPGRSTTITATSTTTGLAYTYTRNNVATGVTGASQFVNIDSLGTYRVTGTLTGVSGCTGTSNALVIGTEASERLFIYPNPTDGAFQVRLFQLSDFPTRREVSVYNSTGQMVAHKTFDFVRGMSPYYKMDFDLSRLAPGTYVVKATEKNTTRIVSGLLIIQ